MPNKSRGDNIWFFLLYTMFGAIWFFILGYLYDIFHTISEISEILTMDFLMIMINIIFINLLSSSIAWISAFLILKYIKRYVFNTEIRSFGDLSDGINKFPLLSLTALLSIILSSLLYAIGFLAILQNSLFAENGFLSLILTYFLIKIFIHVFVIIIIESKL